MDGTSHLSPDTPIIDSTTTIKTDNDDIGTESSSLPDESTEPSYPSSLSFFDLVETMFLKKEDAKPVEQVSTNVKEEMPLLSTAHEPESESLIPNNSEEMRMTSD
jgi:hypothetical protein